MLIFFYVTAWNLYILQIKIEKVQLVEEEINLMCQIMIRMIYAKEMFNVLTNWFIRIWRNIPHKNLQMKLELIKQMYK